MRRSSNWCENTNSCISSKVTRSRTCWPWCCVAFSGSTRWCTGLYRGSVKDQELACDARVIARNPEGRRAYGEALICAQLPALTGPSSCQMSFAHPLKERITMLKQPVPTYTTRMTGFAAVLLLATAAGFAGNAAQEARSGSDSPPKVISRPAFPPYPEAALALHLSGRVDILAAFNDQGEARVLRSGSLIPQVCSTTLLSSMQGRYGSGRRSRTASR